MPDIKPSGGTIRGIGRASFATISIPASEIAAPDPSDPGFYMQIDNVPQPADEDGNPVVRQRISVTRHEGTQHDAWSGFVDEQSQDVQDTLAKLLNLVLVVAVPAMDPRYGEAKVDPPIKVG